MVTIPLGLGDWGSEDQKIPRIKLRNMYLIDNPTSPDGVSRVSRPTLDQWTTVGTGPIRGVWRQDATFNGDYFVVSGTDLWRVNSDTGASTSIGIITGLDYAQFAGVGDRIIIVSNGVARSYDGTTLSTIAMPDDVPGLPAGVPAPVQSVATINSYFILTVRGSQRFYWLEPNQVDPDPLSFASAERRPDPIEAVAIVSDEVWFLGTEGPEVWAATGENDLPFQRISGRVYSDGCLSRNTVVPCVFQNNPALIWLTPSRTIVMAQGGVSRVSSHYEEELLKTGTNFRAWGFRHNRTDFYIISSNQFTLVYNLQRREWQRWDSFQRNYWRAHLGETKGVVPVAGDHESNTLWKLVQGVADVNDPVIREVGGFVSNTSDPISCSRVTVRINAGWVPSYDYEPFMEMKWSDDQGATWTAYEPISFGKKGDYRQDTELRSLGRISRPGRYFEFRFTEKATFRLDYATMNE